MANSCTFWSKHLKSKSSPLGATITYTTLDARRAIKQHIHMLVCPWELFRASTHFDKVNYEWQAAAESWEPLIAQFLLEIDAEFENLYVSRGHELCLPKYGINTWYSLRGAALESFFPYLNEVLHLVFRIVGSWTTLANCHLNTQAPPRLFRWHHINIIRTIHVNSEMSTLLRSSLTCPCFLFHGMSFPALVRWYIMLQDPFLENAIILDRTICPPNFSPV